MQMVIGMETLEVALMCLGRVTGFIQVPAGGKCVVYFLRYRERKKDIIMRMAVGQDTLEVALM